MKARSDLFQLIHSLDEGERRYFKLHSQLHVRSGQNNYIRLFDAILKQEVFDETGLKAQFEGEALLNQFSVAKNYLTNAIMRALRAYHHNRNLDMQLRESLDFAEISLQKGLFKATQRYLRKARKLAVAHEKFPQLIEILIWELRLLKMEWRPTRKADLEAAYQKLSETLNQLDNELQLRRLHDQIYSTLAARVELRKESEMQMARTVMANPLMESPNRSESWNAKIVYHYTHAYFGRLQGDIKTMKEHFGRMVTLWESAPQRIAEEGERYLKTIMGYLDACLMDGDTKHFEEVLGKIKRFKANTPKLKALVFRIPIHLELRHHLVTEAYEKGFELGKRIEKGLRIHAAHISKEVRQYFIYNQIVLFFLGKQYSSCLKWSRKILDEPVAATREDIRMAVRVFSLIAHHEQQDGEYLEYALRAASRSLKKEAESHRFELMVVEHLKAMNQQSSVKHRDELSRSFLKEVQVLGKGKHYLGLVEVERWLRGSGKYE